MEQMKMLGSFETIKQEDMLLVKGGANWQAGQNALIATAQITLGITTIIATKGAGTSAGLILLGNGLNRLGGL